MSTLSNDTGRRSLRYFMRKSTLKDEEPDYSSEQTAHQPTTHPAHQLSQPFCEPIA